MNTSNHASELLSVPNKNHHIHSKTIIARLLRRDYQSLIVFAVNSLILIGGGEWAAFHLKMVDRFGIEPVLIRAALYIALSLVLWSFLLGKNRCQIAELLRRSESYFQSLLYAYEEALGLKDSYTGGHGRRVSRYCRVLSDLLKLPAEQKVRLEQAALLHDIGKIGVPDAVLTKPESLTPQEWKFIREHPLSGAALLEKIDTLKDLAPMVRGHHERYNGGGYPDGLAGNEIPFEARLIAIADTLDAITTTRSYRSRASFETAIGELRKSAGTYFDPELMTEILTIEGQAELKREYGNLKRAVTS